LIPFDRFRQVAASTPGFCPVAAGPAPCIQPATAGCVQGTTETGRAATEVEGLLRV